MVELEMHDGWVYVTANKCLLVLSREEFIAALKRGKRHRRHQALAAWLAQHGENAERST
jgi:hypothetical protein